MNERTGGKDKKTKNQQTLATKTESQNTAMKQSGVIQRMANNQTNTIQGLVPHKRSNISHGTWRAKSFYVCKKHEGGLDLEVTLTGSARTRVRVPSGGLEGASQVRMLQAVFYKCIKCLVVLVLVLVFPFI